MEVWNRKQADAQAQASTLRQQLAALTSRKNTLMDRYLDGKIPQQTYDEQSERLSDEVTEAKSALLQVATNETRIDELLDFAERVLSDPAGLWARASLDQRQRLQQVLFPTGLTYSNKDGFGTGQTLSFFSTLAALDGGQFKFGVPDGI